MRTPAQIAGHPIHPMLVTIPIGLWVFSLVCDLVATRSGAPGTWSTVALYAMVGGIIGALAAAIPGLIDLLSLRDPAIRRTALAHMTLNLTIVVLYLINAWTRIRGDVAPGISLGLSVVAVGLLLVSGWLGGKMIFVAGVAVHADEAVSRQQTQGRPRPMRSGTSAPRSGLRSSDRAMASDRSSRETDRS